MITLDKVKYKDIPKIKEKLLIKQHFLCNICGRDLKILKSRDICLDHNHETGIIRSVLCRGCNSMEGKVYRLYVRLGLRNQGVKYDDILAGLLEYYQDPPKTKYIHPKFKEKKAKK